MLNKNLPFIHTVIPKYEDKLAKLKINLNKILDLVNSKKLKLLNIEE